MVIRIQVNVFGREVAGPEGDGGIALLKAKVDVRVSILSNRCRDSFRIECWTWSLDISWFALAANAPFSPNTLPHAYENSFTRGISEPPHSRRLPK